MPYHHGNVRAAMLEAAAQAVIERGAVAVSLRDLARRVGVSHSAAAHHFGDKTGLLTALATEGFQRLTDALHGTWNETDSFAAVGIAYVQFAVENPAHFEVMFRPELYRQDDEELMAARIVGAAALFAAAGEVADAASGDTRRAAIAGWALVHGLATLWREGNFGGLVPDPVAFAEELVPLLFQGSKAARKRRYGAPDRAPSSSRRKAAPE